MTIEMNKNNVFVVKLKSSIGFRILFITVLTETFNNLRAACVPINEKK